MITSLFFEKTSFPIISGIFAKKADIVYKSYITDGISRIEKVNGRFLASQLVKLDILSQQNNQIIKQNNEIIGLLKEIAKK